MLNQVRKFINSRAPSWLTQEIRLFSPTKPLNKVEVIEPLKGVTNTPHWKRIKTVYQALDNAQNEGIVKYTDLIKYVKNETSKGCSRKLIAKWKRQQE
ncbi:hypothetical protein [Merismopedia glauca]|uniref:Uncharacterized protein n=1 Tax=Merismopedia glauca CCAP 1448/3 TaxID=1296344 RepID=A0A2T1BXU3_9CYAN|nr:hypothetical protein [Merismopedia glauca]PSB00830.1 hypothetical protein C7B64_21395 [Merismopedia glauca CCAP 1448/3]